jgi:hypothetical protein
VSKPTSDIFEAIAANQEISLPPDLLAAAVEAHSVLRPKLVKLRNHQLSFLDLTEPMTAVRWIENGGRSTPTASASRAKAR